MGTFFCFSYLYTPFDVMQLYRANLDEILSFYIHSLDTISMYDYLHCFYMQHHLLDSRRKNHITLFRVFTLLYL